MKTKYISTILLLLTVTISSCKKKDSEKKDNELETKHIKKVLNNLEINKNVSWVVVLPGLGCKGCIQEAELFMQENIENENILFVLTKVESLKILQAKIEIRLNDYNNIVIDKENDFELRTDNTIYPCIITIENGRYTSHEFQSPENSQAFQRLESKIP